MPAAETQRRVAAMLALMDVADAASHVEMAGGAGLGVCGAAPGWAAAGGMVAVFDGHVFNRAELGADEQSPAVLLLALVRERGFEAALRAINGDFAAAVYDSASNILWLGRDRVGVQPLFYARTSGGFAFASRLRGLLDQPGVSRRANRRFAALFAASHYRTFDNDSGASPFADIAQLPAAHTLRVNATGEVKVARYWDLGELPEHTGSLKELAAGYRDLLIDAVKIRLQVARQPAFTLSGGMDSSSVLACAVRSSGEKQHAFSSVYDDKTYDESDEIASMLASSVRQWHPLKIGTPDVPTLVARMVAAHDEPVATATWLSHYLICESASAQGFGSLIGGLGGDELNAGEYEHFFYRFADLRGQGREQELQAEVEKWVEYHDHPIHRKSMAVVEDHFNRVVDLRRPGVCLPDHKRLDRYAAVLDPEFFALAAYRPEMDTPFNSYLKNRTYQDIFRETAPCCLRAEDRQGAAFGMEHFDPFFDYRLIEYMFRVPGTMKIRGGVTKILLREAMRGVLPEETRTRIKKTGWNAPAHVWFSGSALETLRDTIHSAQFRQRGIYLLPAVDNILAEHERIVAGQEIKDNHMMFLWQLLNLDVWARDMGVSF